MITAFANTMKVPDLRSRILFTLAMIVIVRLGVHLPLPGVDVEALKNYMDSQAQSKDGPFGALGAILTILLAEMILPLLPYMLSFAAGAMLYVVVEELIPEMSEGEHSNIGTVFFAVGFTLMMMLDVALG